MQILVSRINAVYGAFAAVPLFLIWMNVSWIIILIGAEISHAYQYAESPASEMPKQIKQFYPDRILPENTEENERKCNSKL